MFRLMYPWFFFPKIKQKVSTGLRVPFYDEIVNRFAVDLMAKDRLLSRYLFFICWVLLVIALVSPQFVGEGISLKREGRNILMALDLSDSMGLTDTQLYGQPVSRLTIVKKAALDFIKDRTDDRIGLILFGTRAYLQSPLTYDHAHVAEIIKNTSPGLAGQTTSIGDALGLAVKELKNMTSKNPVIILLTDGVNNSGVFEPLKAASLAKSFHIKVYTIGLNLAFDGDFFPQNMADLDENTLKKIADMTGGQYFRATDPQSLQAIYGVINQLEMEQQASEKLYPEKNYYPWFLGSALLIFCFALWASRRVNG